LHDPILQPPASSFFAGRHYISTEIRVILLVNPGCFRGIHVIDLAHTVSVARGSSIYPSIPPYSPGIAWPEYSRIHDAAGEIPNDAYSSVRESFRLLRLDERNFGSPSWNPLKGIVLPGDKVIIKPNFVRDFRESDLNDGDCLITHGSVIRAVIDYVFLALGGDGRIVIADAPQNDADFLKISKITCLESICMHYKKKLNFPIEVIDLRQETAKKIDGVIVGHTPLRGDPSGYVKVNLGERSVFAEIESLCTKLYGAEYERSEIVAHHTGGKHEYLISKTILEADCLINIPKLKTHKKTGLTANLKNLVGINGDKNWLPHHRLGTPKQGGDEFNEDSLLRVVEQVFVEKFKQVFPALGKYRSAVAASIKYVGKKVFGDTNVDTVRSGNWYGNDTTWRMVLDLNRILQYADVNGNIQENKVRRFFSVVDGIIAGEGNGPLDPTPKQAGLIISGKNPVAVDIVCSRLMGFDHRKIPMLRKALELNSLPIAEFSMEDLTVCSNDPSLNCLFIDLHGQLLSFRPHFGWKGNIEWIEQR